VCNMGLLDLTSLSCSFCADSGYSDSNRGHVILRKRHFWTEELCKEHNLCERERSVSIENRLLAIW
jgi:hypothetical protein